jgi:hypothetical protein
MILIGLIVSSLFLAICLNYVYMIGFVEDYHIREVKVQKFKDNFWRMFGFVLAFELVAVCIIVIVLYSS